METAKGLTAPTLLSTEDDVTQFDCGVSDLDIWLKKKALNSQNQGNARIYVVKDANNPAVVGYYAIAMGSVRRESAISSLRRNSPNPIPMVILARLAVHREYNKLGIGSGLLKDCVMRSIHAMEIVGGAGILVHAIDESAQQFYTKFGFQPSPFNNMVLMARMKDIKAVITRPSLS